MSKRKVSYYYDPEVGAYTYGLGHPMKPHRIRMAHELISAYDMLGKMEIIRPNRASPQVMSSFHTDEYIHFLNRVTPELADELTYHGTRFLVGEDNPPFEGLFEFCSISAGGSISAAKRIASGAADIAVNWAGGLHHAKKREASGFCYVNDIVLGILELLRTYPRVVYIDIDCHHGDGVEEAFYTTDRVMTCSFHKYGDYFPGTGTQDDQGRGKGKGYAINVPLKDGITDESFKSVFEPVIDKILEVFQPSAVILQCGADSLSGDKLGCFNLTMRGHAHCVQFMRSKNFPLIILGGGGYTVKNVARTWAFETACAIGVEDEIDEKLPWNEYFEWFGPRYRLEVMESNMDDLNVKEGTIANVRDRALQQISSLVPSPSVGMHDVPKDSVDQHLGFFKEEEDGKDELDQRLAQHIRYVYDLQESDTATSSSEGEDDFWDSEDETTSTRSLRLQRRKYNGSVNRRRVSILTNQYFDVPHDIPYQCGPTLAGKNPRRRFFNTEDRWDDRYREIIRAREGKDLPWPHLYRPQRPDDIQEDEDIVGSDEGDDGSEDLEMQVD